MSPNGDILDKLRADINRAVKRRNQAPRDKTETVQHSPVPLLNNHPLLHVIPTPSHQFTLLLFMGILIFVTIILYFIGGAVTFLKSTTIEFKDALSSFFGSVLAFTISLAPTFHAPTLPIRKVNQLHDFNAYFHSELSPSLAQSRLEIRFLLDEVKSNPVSGIWNDKKWWKFWKPCCKCRLQAQFQTLLAIFHEAQESRTSLHDILEEINKNTVGDIRTQTCRVAMDLTNKHMEQVRKISSFDNKAPDDYLVQLGTTAETVTFGCKMAEVDQDLAQGTLAIMKKELVFLENVLSSLEGIVRKIDRERLKVGAIQKRETTFREWAEEWLEITGRYYIT
ncbi:hypothetical protein FAUST_296 [Fusarium austroamericanum]|uniref:Uncharacterized protein n=1 Tax=Fusarium austroamericanum TaxID=282268 RepID=A0AAN6CAY5_FUSAU|nr:hypothetical protein FAUST_296 [Fusarium austroamericanum]